MRHFTKRQSTIALALTGLILGGGTTVLFAGDPPVPAPLSSGQAAEIQQRVEDLGSADFRVREAAWKALVGYGDKARPALEAALKSDNPSVRFRSEQLIARLNGGTQEKPLDDGTPAPVRPTPGGPLPGGGGVAPVGPGRFFTDQDFDRLMRETQERMQKLQEEMRKEFGNAGPSFGPQWAGPRQGTNVPSWLERWDKHTRRGELRVQVDGGDLLVSPVGAVRLQLTEKADNGVSMSTVYEGKSLDAVFEAFPDLRGRPTVKALLEKKAIEDAARAEREKAVKDSLAQPGFQSSNKTVTVQSQDGHTTVTITETGPDGKQVTKTYEGADMESIKRDHPEIGDSLGGIRIEIAPGGGMNFGGGIKPGEPLPADEFGAEKAEPQTGPFGLGLSPVDDALRQHLNLEAGTGAVVAAVREGSHADKIGLKTNDVITAVNGTTVTGTEKLAELVHAAGDGVLSIDVLRAGKPLTLRR